MSETPFAPAASTTFFKVICALGQVLSDGADGDLHPDLVTQGGTVKIVMDADRARYTGLDGKARMLTLSESTYNIQVATGELIDNNGEIGVWLLNTASPGVDPSGFTYTATITPTIGKPWAVTFSGNQTGTVDLALLANVPANAGTASLTSRVVALEAGGAVYTSPNGTKYQIQVSDAGVLSTVVVP